MWGCVSAGNVRKEGPEDDVRASNTQLALWVLKIRHPLCSHEHQRIVICVCVFVCFVSVHTNFVKLWQ